MNIYLNQMQMHVPELELYNRYNNLYIRNKSYEEAKAVLAKFAVSPPSEFQETEYMQKTYAEKEIYLINGGHYLLKQNRNTGIPYLFRT